MQRWMGVCAYDGTDFEGWQSQVSGNTIQDFLERRLAQIFGSRIAVIGSGRTDSGVHARAQVFHFDAPDWLHGADCLLRALRCGFPKTLQVRQIKLSDPEFHARFSAIGKRYVYVLRRGSADPFQFRHCWPLGNFPLDLEKMQLAVQLFVGAHNFSAFANRRRDGSNGSPVKSLSRSELVCDGDTYNYVTEGSGYLYRMVRRIVGTLVDIGRGRATETDIADRLNFPENFAKKSLTVAPANGLFLDEVFY